MRRWSATFFRACWGGSLLLTSLYCLLAFLPYTYYALIKAPAYEWIPWFVHHQSLVYWVTLAGIAWAYAPERSRLAYRVVFAILVLMGAGVTVRPFLSSLQNTSAAYAWSLAVLIPLMLTASLDLRPALENKRELSSPLSYSTAAVAGVFVALVYAAGVKLRTFLEAGSLAWGWLELELLGWSVFSHLTVAVILVSILNLVGWAARKMRNPSLMQAGITMLLITGALGFAVARFLGSALSFEGWPAHLYAAMLAAALVLFGRSLALPVMHPRCSSEAHWGKLTLLMPAAVAGTLSVVAMFLPAIIRGGDWNGVLQGSFALVFWLVLGICAYRLRSPQVSYSGSAILAVLVLAACSYKGLQASAFFWAKPMGATDDDVARTLTAYADQDASFQIAHHVLGNSRSQSCGELCRILRQHTNIRDAEVRFDLELVDRMEALPGPPPNIFLFVMDSMRPDYLGAYNQKVDFTPNLDSFARESVVLRNVYTQYAGTVLSEPAIWSGALLLHSHYMQPFRRVNSLEKLAKAGGYQMVVSYDTVLREILDPADDLVKLDTDKPLWNRFEVCSTIEQLEAMLDRRPGPQRPVFFFAQPMNLHQFARNNNPLPDKSNWRMRPGFNNRIAYEAHQVDTCLGQFISYLKSRGMYDNSIVILTADHGDATGEFGRFSHSLSIYPEVMRVPLIIHLPGSMRQRLIYDDTRISTLTDIAPTLYRLLGYGPIRRNPLFGRPLFAETRQELESYRRDELFLASDVRAAYGILSGDGRFLYTVYDSPSQSFLFDLKNDPNAQHNILSETAKKDYDRRVIGHLQSLADFYGYKPGVGSLLAASH